jgi:hypothetical protein
MDNYLRTATYKQSKELEKLLQKLNSLLQEVELAEISGLTKPQLPTLLIVGNPRSGTTLLYQWLAATGLFAYPSNIMSRFYNAPYIGGLIHKILVEYDKHEELCGGRQFNFISSLGKTKGAHSPHEFWYFWRRFFHFGEIQKLRESELVNVNHELFLKELAAIELCFGKPLLLKALIMNWNIDYLNNILEKPLFLFIKRKEINNMASLYNTRKNFFDDPFQWYSFKPPEYEVLKEKNVYLQLAGQVYYTNKAIEKSLRKIQSERYLVISYEKFCAEPEEHYHAVRSLLRLNGYDTKQDYSGPVSFKPSVNFDVEFNKDRAKKAFSILKKRSDF